MDWSLYNFNSRNPWHAGILLTGDSTAVDNCEVNRCFKENLIINLLLAIQILDFNPRDLHQNVMENTDTNQYSNEAVKHYLIIYKLSWIMQKWPEKASCSLFSYFM